MNYLGQDYLKKRIEQNQKFLLRLVNLHIGSYFPLRKWLGIDYTGKIDEISHLSYAYNTEYFKKGNQWYKRQTRVYQQPDLGYKLNLILDRIPQLVLLPAFLQPAFRLASVLLFSLTTTTYQPSTKDTMLSSDNPTTNYGTDTSFTLGMTRDKGYFRVLEDFDISDIPNGANFTQGDVSLYQSRCAGSFYCYIYRVTQLGWTETGATWNTYNGTNSWTTAGGDYTTTNGLRINMPQGTAQWDTWSVPLLVQDCFNNQNKHVNVIMKAEVESNNNYYATVYSREYTTDPTLRPKLTVTYTVPSSSSFFLLMANE